MEVLWRSQSDQILWKGSCFDQWGSSEDFWNKSSHTKEAGNEKDLKPLFYVLNEYAKSHIAGGFSYGHS